MRHFGAGLFAVTFSLLASQAAAQVPDHLECYKVKNPAAKTTYTADLDGLTVQAGCVIKVPAKLACVPATKTNVAPAPPGGGGSGTPNSFFCYTVKCPKTALPPLSGADQFGSWTVTPAKAKLVCAPLAEPPTTTTTTSSTTTTTLNPTGASCNVNGDCQSDNCQCANASCDARICATVSCNVSCQFAQVGGTSCDDIPVGMDPRDACAQACNGDGSCQSCGDGLIQGVEDCDDGNGSNGDGCGESCSIEPGFICGGEPSVCNNCGDGLIQGVEDCDDGNGSNGDGCGESCSIEPGFICGGEPSVCSSCGDGLVQGVESCDDGNDTTDDGCDDTCDVEDGFECTGEPSVCVPL